MNKTEKRKMCKSEVRKAISSDVKFIKSSVLLDRIHTVTDTTRRRYDEEEYDSLTEREFELESIMSSAFRIKNEKHLRKLMIIAGRLEAAK